MLAAAPAVAVVANETGDPVSVPEVAVNVCAPAVWPSVPTAEVVPSAAVGAATVTLPVAGAVKLTAVPETALLKESVTLTTNGCRRERPTVPVWPPPETAAILAAAPALAVAAKEIGDAASVPELAVNVCAPATWPSVPIAEAVPSAAVGGATVTLPV